MYSNSKKNKITQKPRTIQKELKMKELQDRLTKLYNNNNFVEINSLETIYKKSVNLFEQHKSYNKLKREHPENTRIIRKTLKNLLYNYREIIESMEIYPDIKGLVSIKKKLLTNLNDLSGEENSILYSNVNSVNELQKRLNILEMSFPFPKKKKISKKKKSSKKKGTIKK